MLQGICGKQIGQTDRQSHKSAHLRVVQYFNNKSLIGPRREKTCLRGFRQSQFHTGLLSYKIEISPVASLNMVLSKKRITKALIRLRGCAGWSAPVLFAKPRRQVSRVEAQLS